MLLPMLRAAGIEPVLCLLTEVGRYDRFLDIFRYESVERYVSQTDAFLQDERLQIYYSSVCQCVTGHIEVELAVEFPHLAGQHPRV
jgi:hypothetical protein